MMLKNYSELFKCYQNSRNTDWGSWKETTVKRIIELLKKCVLSLKGVLFINDEKGQQFGIIQVRKFPMEKIELLSLNIESTDVCQPQVKGWTCLSHKKSVLSPKILAAVYDLRYCSVIAFTSFWIPPISVPWSKIL
jgi:hypothetical protein